MSIDLGDELDGYSEPEPDYPAHCQPNPTRLDGGGHILPLADLQRAGFNISDPDDIEQRLYGVPLPVIPFHYPQQGD